MISVLYTIILITNFKLIEMCIKSSPMGEGSGVRPVVVVVVFTLPLVHPLLYSPFLSAWGRDSFSPLSTPPSE